MDKIYSWEIISDSVVVKLADKSVFHYNETGVPIEVRNFWDVENLKQGQKRNLTLYYMASAYQAHIQMENSKRLRTKLSWPKALTKNITYRYKHPQIRFEKIEKDGYRVDFIYNELINEDCRLENNIIFENEKADIGRYEGRLREYNSKQYERDPKNRAMAIKLHGLVCKVCEFDFGEKYGLWGQGYIEVHHIDALNTHNGEAHFVDPKTDLVPVCANCHRMLHRKRDCVLTLDELKEYLKRF